MKSKGLEILERVSAVGERVRRDYFKVLLPHMMSQNKEHPPLGPARLNALHSLIVGLQWGLSVDTEHME